MKYSRDPSKWEIEEIEQDSAGYNATQEAYKARQEKEAERRHKQFVKEHFLRNFTNRDEGEAEWEKARLEAEAQSARAEDEAARRYMITQIRRAI